MATADLALRVVAQVDQAVAGLRRLGAETKAVDTQVAQTQTRFGRIGQAFANLGQTVTGAVSGGGGAGEALGGISGAVAGGGLVGAILEIVQKAIGVANSQVANQLQRNLSREQFNLQNPTSGQDIVNNLKAAGGNRAWMDFLTSPGNAVRTLGDIFTGKADLTSPSGWLIGAGAQRQTLAQFRDLARSNPTWALQALQTGQLGPEETKAYNQIFGRQYKTQAFQGAAQINVYTGVGDPNQVGREVRAALDARDRNNGRYQTTVTRRG